MIQFVSPKVLSWATYKKKFNPDIYQVQDSTLGFCYTVEPTMRNAGFIQEALPTKYGDVCPSFGVDERNGTPKSQVVNYIKNNKNYEGSETVVFYVWFVRGERTMHVDIFRK